MRREEEKEARPPAQAEAQARADLDMSPPVYKFGASSRARLVGVHPDLVLVASRALLYSAYDFTVTEGLRTVDRQRTLVAQGFSQTMFSKHLAGLDGLARAIDVMAVGDLNQNGGLDPQDKALTWDRGVYSAIAGAFHRASVELGIEIRWGGAFKDFFDGPHFELA